MKKLNVLLFLAVGALTVQAAKIEQVIVRQQWPWSTDVKVEYRLSGVTAPVDVGVTAYNGETELPLPASAVVGDLYGIDADGVGQFVIDPVAAFGTAKVALANFKVKLTLAASAANIDEVLYKIFDLSDGSCQDVTRADILDGKYGTYETSYSAFGEGFASPLNDVLVWTGVTNNPAYKTTHLVMRKIPAGDVVWVCGDAEGTLSNRGHLRDRQYVKLSQDYYVGVFEMTACQYGKIFDGSFTGEGEGTDPVTNVQRYVIQGNPIGPGRGVVTGELIAWPTNSYLRDVMADSFLDKLRKKTNVEFDLPTAAEWQFACRAGSDTPLYSGKAQNERNVSEIAWYNSNAGDASHVVGCKPPNAYGLYDMLGNVAEYVHNAGTIHGSKTGSGTADDPFVDPVGSNDAEAIYNSSGEPNQWYMGGSWNADSGTWQDVRQAGAVGWYKWNQAAKPFIGFRVVCPAASAQWAQH